MRREKWIDVSKAIAILMVIIGHADPVDFGFVYGMHLFIFFVLSGYTMHVNSITVEYINNKFTRLMHPYFTTCFFILIADVCNRIASVGEISIGEIKQIVSYDIIRAFHASGTYTNIGHIEIGGRIGAIWFLPAMFFSVLIIQIVLKVFKNNIDRSVILILVALLGIITARFIWLPFSVQAACMASVFIWIGYRLKEQKAISCVIDKKIIIGAIVILAAGIYKGYCGMAIVTADINDLIVSVVVAASGFILVTFFAKKIQDNIFLNFIGKNSLYVLCVHLFILETCWQYITFFTDKLGFTNDGIYRRLIITILNIVLALIGAYIVIQINKLIVRLFKKINTEKIKIFFAFILVVFGVGIYILDSSLTLYDILFNGIFLPSIIFFIALKYRDEQINILFLIGNIAFWGFLYEKHFSNYLTESIIIIAIALLINRAIGKCHFCEQYRLCIMLCIAYVGYLLIQHGKYLSGTAFNMAIFAFCGYAVKKYKKASSILGCKGLYFLASPIFAYYIYTVLNNELFCAQYGFNLIGMGSGVLMLYSLLVSI